MSFKDRLKEPSTYVGLAVLGQIFGVKELAAIGTPDVITGLMALAAVFMGEKGSPAPTSTAQSAGTEKPL